MLPGANDPVWSQIATGKRPFGSTSLAMNLLETNNRMSFAKDASPANVSRLAHVTYVFFVKYEKLFAAAFARILA